MSVSGVKILVIEDDNASYKLIAAALRAFNLEMLHAENGKQAVNFFNANEDIQMVLLDIQLPEMNGYEVLTHIKTKRPELPVIAQTAYSMTNDREKCLKAGCDDYISKPLSIVKLRELVGKYLH